MYLKDMPRNRWLQSECGWQWGLGRPPGRSRRKRMALPSSSWTPTRTQSSCGASTFYPLHAQTSNLTRSNVVFFIPNGKDFDARVCSRVYPPEVYGLANKAVLDMCRGSFVDFTEFQFDAVLPSTALQVDVYNMAARAVVLVHTKTWTHTDLVSFPPTLWKSMPDLGHICMLHRWVCYMYI